MTTQVANQPHESGRHLWQSLRRDAEPRSVLANRMRAEAARALGATPARRADGARIPVETGRHTEEVIPIATWEVCPRRMRFEACLPPLDRLATPACFQI